jgi:hypothetical protein
MALPESLKDKDLLPSLRWATNAVAGNGRSGNAHARRLADAIMFKVWPIFEHADLTYPFVDNIAARLRITAPSSSDSITRNRQRSAKSC